MGTVMVGNFGVIDGFQTFRVCGEKPDLLQAIKQCNDLGFVFENDVTPKIEHVHHGQFTLLLKIKVPVGVGSRESNST